MWSGLFSPPCAYSEPSEVDALEHVEKPEPEQTRPAEPELLEPKTEPETEGWAWARQELHSKHFPYNEQLAYDRDLKKHFPHGVDDSITTAAVFDKLDKDPDLKAELSGRRPPSMTLINRMLAPEVLPSFGKSNPAGWSLWACPCMGMPTMPKLKPLIRR